MKRAAPVFTDLGMHFVDTGAEVVLVQIEVKVRGLLAVHARRLIKSKRGTANVSQGTVRMSIATPDDQERAARARAVAEELASLQHKGAELQLSLAVTASKATKRTCHRV